MLVPRAWLKADPPEAVRRLETAALMGVFAHAFDVRAPRLEDMGADEALFAFREFTAACMEAANAGGPFATAWYGNRLGRDARRLGEGVRRALCVGKDEAFDVTAWFYKGIRIQLEGELPGRLTFSRCYFAERYTEDDCRLMARFDEGFMAGMCGGGNLEFSCRATCGAECCLATFSKGEGQ